MLNKASKSYVINLHVLIFLINIILYFYLKTQDSPFKSLVVAIIMAHILLCVFLYIRKNQRVFLLNYSQSAKLPIKKITNKNSKYLKIFIALIATVCSLVALVLNDRVLGKLSEIVKNILHNFFALFFDKVGMKADKTIPQYNKQLINASNSDLFKDMKYLRFIQIALIILGIIVIIRIIRISFGTGIKKSNKASNDQVSIRESNDTYADARDDTNKKIGFFPKNNNEKIRKRYIKLVKKSNKDKKRILKSMTPSEVERYVGLDSLDNIDSINYLYQKARYSNHECTNDDYKKMKNGL